MIENEIKILSKDGQVFDKKQLALAIRNSTLDDNMRCSLLDQYIIKNCESCSLSEICSGIDKITEEFIASTTKVTNSFTFS